MNSINLKDRETPSPTVGKQETKKEKIKVIAAAPSRKAQRGSQFWTLGKRDRKWAPLGIGYCACKPFGSLKRSVLAPPQQFLCLSANCEYMHSRASVRTTIAAVIVECQ
jgi:hypothetical protein